MSLTHFNPQLNPMKHLVLLLTTLLALTLRIDAQPAATPPPAGPYSQDGIWKPIAAILGGARLPEPALKAITLKITGTNYVVSVEGEPQADKGTCTLDTTTTPKRMTIKSTEGPNQGKTFLAIYEMKDAVSMRICYDLSGTDFPKEFKAPPGTQFYLVGYRRQPAPSAGPATPK